MRYYKQRFGAERALVLSHNSNAVGRVLRQYRALGWGGEGESIQSQERAAALQLGWVSALEFRLFRECDGKALFLVCSPGASIQQKQRDMQYVQMMKSKWRLKMGMKHNTTRQKHFRAQVIF